MQADSLLSEPPGKPTSNLSLLLLSGESDLGHPREHLRRGKEPHRVGVIPATTGCLRWGVNRVEDPHCLVMPTLSLARDQRWHPRSVSQTHMQEPVHRPRRAASAARAKSSTRLLSKGQEPCRHPEGQSPHRQTPKKTMSALLEPSVYHVCLRFRALLY